MTHEQFIISYDNAASEDTDISWAHNLGLAVFSPIRTGVVLPGDQM